MIKDFMLVGFVAAVAYFGWPYLGEFWAILRSVFSSLSSTMGYGA